MTSLSLLRASSAASWEENRTKPSPEFLPLWSMMMVIPFSTISKPEVIKQVFILLFIILSLSASQIFVKKRNILFIQWAIQSNVLLANQVTSAVMKNQRWYVTKYNYSSTVLKHKFKVLVLHYTSQRQIFTPFYFLDSFSYLQSFIWWLWIILINWIIKFLHGLRKLSNFLSKINYVINCFSELMRVRFL